MSLDTNFFKKKYSENININENLAKYSWFNLGGPADLLFKPFLFISSLRPLRSGSASTRTPC